MDKVIYEKKDKIAFITLNRPETINSYDQAMTRELEEIWEDVENDPNVWVGIVSGAGERGFCAGHDLKEIASERARGPLKTLWGHDIEVWKPLVAAIHGYCLAGGLDFALACDIRIAAENAIFGVPMARSGLMPRFPLRLALCSSSPNKMLEILITGERIDAQEAYRMGMVNQVVPVGDLLPTAIKYAERICENGPLAVRGIKKAIVGGMSAIMEAGLAVGNRAYAEVQQSEDAKEGPRAFTEKRRPQFKGR